MPRWGIISIFGILAAGLVIGIYLVQESQMIGKQASGTADTQFICDSGPDPYNSNTITLTNNTTQTISEISSNVVRCEYEPNKIRKGYYSCQDDCTGQGPDCQEGLWDPEFSQELSLSPGESKTLSVTADPCEIVQLDVQNDVINVTDNPTECFNIQSQNVNPLPPNRWPGGIAFAIQENPTGYNAQTGICDTGQTQPTSTPVSTVSPTNSPNATATPQPTTPPGQPTYTPIPTITPTISVSNPTATPQIIPTNTPYVISTSTPIPTQPVTGSSGISTIGILGGVGLLILTLL